MNIQGLSDRDLKSLVKFGSDEGIVARAQAELRSRAPKSEMLKADTLKVACEVGCQNATEHNPFPKGRW